MFALLHPSKTSVYETRLMGICVVNKSWIAVLARPKKYEIPPLSVELHQSASIQGDRPLTILSRHLGQNCERMERSTIRHTELRLVCVRLSSRHTSLNYSALLAGSRGSRTSIFFNPSAVLSLVGFVLQQCQGWATDYPEPGLGIIFQNTNLM